MHEFTFPGALYIGTASFYDAKLSREHFREGFEQMINK
jgi:hypothetical protein